MTNKLISPSPIWSYQFLRSFSSPIWFYQFSAYLRPDRRYDCITVLKKLKKLNCMRALIISAIHTKYRWPILRHILHLRSQNMTRGNTLGQLCSLAGRDDTLLPRPSAAPIFCPSLRACKLRSSSSTHCDRITADWCDLDKMSSCMSSAAVA